MIRRLIAAAFLVVVAVLVPVSLLGAGVVAADHCRVVCITPQPTDTPVPVPFQAPVPSATPSPTEVATPYSGPAPSLNHDPVVVEQAQLPLHELALSTAPQLANNSSDATGLAITAMIVSGLIAISSFGLFLKLR